MGQWVRDETRSDAELGDRYGTRHAATINVRNAPADTPGFAPPPCPERPGVALGAETFQRIDPTGSAVDAGGKLMFEG